MEYGRSAAPESQMQRKSRRWQDGTTQIAGGCRQTGWRGGRRRDCPLHAGQHQTFGASLVMVGKGLVDAMRRQGKLRPEQGERKQEHSCEPFHAEAFAHCAQVPRTSNSTSESRKPRGSLGGGGGGALRQNIPPQPVQRKCT